MLHSEAYPHNEAHIRLPAGPEAEL